MAITKRDMLLKSRIENLLKQFQDKPDKEVIYLISGLCKISHRVASENFHAFKAKQTLLASGFKDNCTHDWSNAFATPGGLCKECRLCGITEFIEVAKEDAK